MYTVTFGTKRSYADWGVILTNYINTPPAGKRTIVEVPYRNGDLDITAVLTPNIKYTTRTLEFTFELSDSITNYQTIVDTIMEDVHGQTLNVVISSDPNWYWDCYCEVTNSEINVKHGVIVVTCIAQPYRLKSALTTYTQSGDGTITCVNEQMLVSPTVTVTDDTTIAFDGTTTTLSAGTHYLPGIVLAAGNNVLTVTTTGDVTVTYREGKL